MENLLNEIEDFLTIGIILKKNQNEDRTIGMNHFISRLEWIIKKYRGEKHLIEYYKSHDIKYVHNDGLCDEENMKGSYYIK